MKTKQFSDLRSCLFVLMQVLSKEELEMIADLCKKWNVLCVSDEVYEWLVYPGSEHIRIGGSRILIKYLLTLNENSSGSMLGPSIKVYSEEGNLPTKDSSKYHTQKSLYKGQPKRIASL